MAGREDLTFDQIHIKTLQGELPETNPVEASIKGQHTRREVDDIDDWTKILEGNKSPDLYEQLVMDLSNGMQSNGVKGDLDDVLRRTALGQYRTTGEIPDLPMLLAEKQAAIIQSLLRKVGTQHEAIPMRSESKLETEQPVATLEQTVAKLIGNLAKFKEAGVLPIDIPKNEEFFVDLPKDIASKLGQVLSKDPVYLQNESSGVIRLKPDRAVKVGGKTMKLYMVENIEFIEVGTPKEVRLPLEEDIKAGEILFHTHIVDESEPDAVFDELTVADIMNMVEGPGWKDPTSDTEDEKLKIHAVITIVRRKNLFGRQSNDAYFSFFSQDLNSDSAKNAEPPYGLTKLFYSPAAQIKGRFGLG